MDIANPDPSWLPLRKGVLQYQRSAHLPEMTPAELVQRLASVAAEKHGLSDIEFSAEEEKFYISVGGPVLVEASYFLGAKEITLLSTTAPITDDIVKAVDGGVLELLRHFERLLHSHIRSGLCRAFARLQTPLAREFAELPPDVLAHFTIADWYSGRAASIVGDENLFSIHLAPPDTAARSSAGATVKTAQHRLLANTHQGRFARFVLAEYGGLRPPGKTLGTMRDEFEAKGGVYVDDRTMRDGFKLAASVRQEETGIPGGFPVPVLGKRS